MLRGVRMPIIIAATSFAQVVSNLSENLTGAGRRAVLLCEPKPPRICFRPRISKFVRLGFFSIFALFSATRNVKSDDSYDEKKKQAVELLNQGKYLDAFPILERLHEEKPNDAQVLEGLSFATLARSATLSDPVARREELIKARKLAVEAKAAGDDSKMVKTLLELPEQRTLFFQ